MHVYICRTRSYKRSQADVRLTIMHVILMLECHFLINKLTQKFVYFILY